MLNIRLAESNENLTRFVPIGTVIGMVFISEIIVFIENENFYDTSFLGFDTLVFLPKVENLLAFYFPPEGGNIIVRPSVSFAD
jgi:hypothetical protein